MSTNTRRTTDNDDRPRGQLLDWPTVRDRRRLPDTGPQRLRLSEKLTRAYFNRVYTPTYDATVGRFAAYSNLQERCIQAAKFADGDRVLCVGVGTGNELKRLYALGRRLEITAVDVSENALARARDKARESGQNVRLLRMDAGRLAFADGSFDKVLCIHVMDFVPEAEQATRELVRVLAEGGQFVVTYPYAWEGAGLGAHILGEGVQRNLREGRFRAALTQGLALLAVSFVFLPLYLRPQRREFLPEQLGDLLNSCRAGSLLLDWDRVYVDLIISGRKRGVGADGPEADSPGRRVLQHPQRRRDLAPLLRVP
jgi:SAM-dependent methyltransferase